MRFSIAFHGPFRVGTGSAGGGLDDVIDRSDPLPATSLKGLMRAAAIDLLGAGGLVDEVFGTPSAPSPWSWSGARLEGVTIRRRARVSLDPNTGTAREGALVFVEEVWAERGTFSVDRREPVPPDRISLHELVLACAGQTVTSLGGDRRRGWGWVTIEADPPVTPEHVTRLAALREEAG